MITVEADVTPGMSAFHVIGPPDVTTEPLRDRVRAAILNSGFTWPDALIRINLRLVSSPLGAMADLAVAVALLAAAGHLPADRIAGMMFLGELGLDGWIRPPRGVLPAVGTAVRAGISTVVVPMACADEAAQVPGAEVLPVERLADLVAGLRDGKLDSHVLVVSPAPAVPVRDLADVAGNHAARRALEVCAAGGHHLFMLGNGPTTMLAERLRGILPPLDHAAAREVNEIYSAAGLRDELPGRTPPLRWPHCTATLTALIGNLTRPGEVSLAHHGLLYLADAPEFSRHALDGLRHAAETGEIALASPCHSVRYPAEFQLVLAAQVCPCAGNGPCDCSPLIRRRYLARLAGLLNRVEVRTRIEPLHSAALPGECTATIADRVREARNRAATRLAETPWRTNAEVPGLDLRVRFPADPGAIDLLRSAVDTGLLTSEAFVRVLRVAWTLADLRGADRPTMQDAAGALDLWQGHEG
jgi:magnesium chelatase family protein